MKFFDKDSLWITVSNVIKLIFGFLVVPIIARNVAPAELGKLDLLMAYGPFINQLISMGLTNSSTKFYKANNDEQIVKYMQSKIWIRSLIYILLFWLGFTFFGASRLDIPIIIVLLYSISILLENITFLPQNHFLNKNDFQKYAIVTTLHTIIRHAITLLLVLVMSDKLIALSLGLLISNLYLVVVSLTYHKSILLAKYKKDALSEDFIVTVKKYSFPLFLLGIVGLLYQSSDRLLLSYFGEGNMVQIGYLGMAQRIIGLLTVGLSGLFTVWGIKSFENYADEILVKEKEKFIIMMLLVLVTVMISMSLFKPLIIKFLLTETYRNSFAISALLIGTFVNNRVREILEKFFLKQGNTKLITAVFTSFGVVSVIISGLLLYFYDLEAMLIFRLFIAFAHALTLFFYLRKAKQYVNPILMVVNFALSIVVIVVLKMGWL
jgi:O-antigen/teichoic acid export membrane protein